MNASNEEEENQQNSEQDILFEIGGEILYQRPTSKIPSKEQESLENIRIRFGTLLKTETVSFLLGAGASVACGGQLIGSVPLAVERDLHDKGIAGSDQVHRWLNIFYIAAYQSSYNSSIPFTRNNILSRHEELIKDCVQPLPVNFEQVLATLHRWRAALPKTGGRLRIEGKPGLDAKLEDLDACIYHATSALAQTCNLPTQEKRDGLTAYRTFLRKILTRPLNLKRVNIFTLNYDTLVEQAADAEGVVLLDGFVGTQKRVFRPESYEQDLYFPAETTEGRVHRFDRVLHLYKLHGSITWESTESTIDNPYGIICNHYISDGTKKPLLIYPTPAKYGESLGMPYGELFRRFASAIVRPQSVLFVIGYGFGDEHVNAIIRQALAVPSFTLVIIDPKPKSDFVTKLREQNDRRIWIAEGKSIGTFEGFVQLALPDLRDEEIQKQIYDTLRALTKNSPQDGEDSNGN